jgi:lambda family phage portal protein
LVSFGYDAATKIRTSGRPMPQGGSGDFHLWNDIDALRQESQRFDRDNGLYRGIINRAVDNIIGEGFTLKPETGNKKTNDKLEWLWWDFCKSPEVRGLDDWPSVERLTLRHLLVDGDIGAGKLPDGQIQVIEAERIASSRANADAYLGVETDPVGRPTKYYVCDYTDYGQVDTSEPQQWDADDFVFVSCRNRISQTRGVPAQVCNFAMFHRINDVCDSEAISWQILSRIALAITKEDGSSFGANFGQADTSAEDKDAAQRVVDIGDALIAIGKPGEKITGVDRNVPGANFPNSITMFLRLLGMPLGLPLELVLLDWSKTNYSSARAALLQAYQMFRGWQSLLMRRWHTPIYLWKVNQWVSEGKISPTDRLFEHTWITPPFAWVDPYKEAAAEGLQVDRGYRTFGESLMSRNKDRAAFIEERKREIREAIQTAKALEEETGEKVPWQMFAGLDVNKTQEPANTAPAGGADEMPASGEIDPDREVRTNEPSSS